MSARTKRSPPMPSRMRLRLCSLARRPAKWPSSSLGAWFSAPFLESYLDLAGSAVAKSVGGYQVEGAGIQLFERIEGDHFGILGLPLLALLGFFRREGWLAA